MYKGISFFRMLFQAWFVGFFASIIPVKKVSKTFCPELIKAE